MKSKILMIVPPSGSLTPPDRPFPAIPLLASQLKEVGFDVTCYDFNVEFYHDILNSKFLKNSFKKSNQIKNKFAPNNIKFLLLKKFLPDLKLQKINSKVDIITEYLNTENQTCHFALKHVDNAYKLSNSSLETDVQEKVIADTLIKEATYLLFDKPYESSKSFFKTDSLKNTVIDNILKEAVYMALLPYSCGNECYNSSYESLKERCFDDENNFFINYLKNKIKKLPKDINLICISNLPSYILYPTLTLARLLKEKFPHAKIVLGGDWISRISDNIMKFPDFFNVFCDYVLPFDGEVSIVELAKYIEKQLDITSVSNLIYLNKSNIVCKNKELSKININALAKPDYDDYDFAKYFSEPGISISLSKGCYWGKCRFCSFINGKRFQIKTIDNAIDELKFYINKYSIKEFYFVDDCISPKYYDDLAQAIIDNNLDIHFSSFAILDENFTPQLFNKLKRAGLWRLNWGFETNSKKVFDISNKSGCFYKRADILQASHNAGIVNKLNIMDELPGEQFSDVIDTVKFLRDNLEFIDVFAIHRFRLTRNTEFSLNPHLYNIQIENIDDFALDYNYHKTDQVSFDYVHLRDYYEQIINENLKCRQPIDGRFMLQLLVESYLKKYEKFV